MKNSERIIEATLATLITLILFSVFLLSCNKEDPERINVPAQLVRQSSPCNYNTVFQEFGTGRIISIDCLEFDPNDYSRMRLPGSHKVLSVKDEFNFDRGIYTRVIQLEKIR